VARFLCINTGRTFSLLPYQLIPYHHYTVDAVISTMLLVINRYRCFGQRGYHGASLDLHPDCLVTPYLIYTWTLLVINGFTGSHHILSQRYPLPCSLSGKSLVQTIYLYMTSVSKQGCPQVRFVMEAVRFTAGTTGLFLFGRPSGTRIRSP